jgi:hypothetical protein
MKRVLAVQTLRNSELKFYDNATEGNVVEKLLLYNNEPHYQNTSTDYY